MYFHQKQNDQKNIKKTNNFTSIEHQQKVPFPISFGNEKKKKPSVLNKLKKNLGEEMMVFKEENEIEFEKKEIEKDKKSM